jgi:polar amino acid transport system substrate-binding protein
VRHFQRRKITALLLICPLLAVLGSAIELAAEPEAVFPVPQFRHVDPTRIEPSVRDIALVRFVADDSFPPFSYRDGDGALTGLNVSVADAICRELKLKCEFLVKPWDEAVESVAKGEADAVLSGLKMTPATLERFDFTAPYMRNVGRFAVRNQNQIASPDVKGLAGKRIGVIAGSAHEAWIKAHFPRSLVKPYRAEPEAGEALRTGAVDALFGDAYRLIFWVHGQSSRQCCRLLPGAFVEPGYFSAGISIAVRRGNRRLLDALDYGLDRLQTSGEFSRIYRKFFPEPPA